MLKLFFLLFFSAPLAFSADLETNVLIYTDPVQINSEINEYENIVAGTPIKGSVMITHNADNPIDENSFNLGDTSLKTTFVKTVTMSSSNNLVISIFSFQLPGMEKGMHTLPSIKVKVGGKEYVAPRLNIQVGE